VYLAFTLEKDPKQASVQTLIPQGTAVKSVAGDGELPQTFETSEDLLARAEWNAIRPRQTIPQKVTAENVNSLTSLFIQGIDHQIRPNKRIFVFPEGTDVAATLLTVADVRIDALNQRTELVLGESVFSVRRLSREVRPQVDTLIQRADHDAIRRKLPWIKTNVIDPLQTLVDGDETASPPVPPMANWGALSQYDDYLSQWLTGTGETNARAAALQFSDPTSLHRLLSANLAQRVGSGAAQMFSQALATCKELARFDECAPRVFQAVMNTDPAVASEVTTAQTVLSGIPIPAATELAPHKQRLDRVVTAVTSLVNNPGGAAETAEFIAARDDLKTWWGLTDAGNLNAKANELNTAFLNLQVALEATSPASQKLQELLQAIHDVAAVTPNTQGRPAQERIDQLTAALRAHENGYKQSIDGVLPTTIDGSRILRELDTGVLTPLRNELNTLAKHNQAELLVKPDESPNVATLLINVCSTLASVLQSFDVAIQERRKAFAVEAEEIKNRYQTSLDATAFPSIRQAWTAAKQVLTDAMAESATEPGRYITPLSVTFTALGTDSAPGVIQRLEAVRNDGDDAAKSLIEGLIRQLNGFLARNGGTSSPPDIPPVPKPGGGIGQTVDPSDTAPSVQQRLVRTADEVLAIPANAAADVVAQLTVSFGLITLEQLKAKWQAVRNGEQSAYATTLSDPLPLFGHNAPRPIFDKQLEIPIPVTKIPEWPAIASDYEGHVVLSAVADLQTPTSMIIRSADGAEAEWRISEAHVVSRSDYGLTQKVTRCNLDPPESWSSTNDKTIGTLRTTLAILPARQLTLDEAPLSVFIGKDAEKSELPREFDFAPEVNQIELDGIYLSIQAGQFVIIEGERHEFPGVVSRELRRVKYVQHKMRELPGDKVHTRIFLDADLQHTYIRQSVVVYANVVRATHGETVKQTIGSGDAGKAFQQMPLAKAPLTYLAAPTPSGVESTLQVRVNDLRWHEQTTLLESLPNARHFVTFSDDSRRSWVQFGDGRTGSRLPTGRENVHARYRVGLGKAGNVKAGAISQLANRPLGVKEVINPLPATGGADPESVPQIRGNAPLAVMALDRLVSVRDYADFARNYAGIDKASAVRLLIGGQPTVHITIAGADDIPIAENSDLFRNLFKAYALLGDPFVSIQIAVRELLLLFLSAKVRLKPDYSWEMVEPAIREALYETFSFARRELAQNVYLSEIQTAIQNVQGVAYVDVDALAPVPQGKFEAALNRTNSNSVNQLEDLFQSLRDPSQAVPDAVIHVDAASIALNSAGAPQVLPAQLAYLSRQVSDSLFLSEIR
jgi:hypothetical protein